MSATRSYILLETIYFRHGSQVIIKQSSRKAEKDLIFFSSAVKEEELEKDDPQESSLQM